MKSAIRTIRQSVYIPAKPKKVYETFLRARTHAAFTGSPATCNARVGGRFTAWDGYISGKILKLEAGRKIVQEWQTTEWPPDAPPSIAEFTFEDKDDGTRLTLVQKKVPAEQAESYRQGWIDCYWGPLKQYFAKQ